MRISDWSSDVCSSDLRLREGKVYVPDQAARAVHHFFAPGNLTALRELALRKAADQVDSQMLSYMQSHAIAGPWPTRDRIMACRSEERRVGKECVSTVRSRGLQYL